jgi:UDP-N-acetylmuramyl pentapeptide synthase
MKSSLNQLKNFKENKIFIMGDMGELGDKSLDHHLSVFKLAKDIDVKYLLYMGKYKNEAKSIFGDSCRTFDDIIKLIGYARSISDESTVVLIKASRFMNFDIIAKGLK